jgi:hypothetical protein
VEGEMKENDVEREGRINKDSGGNYCFKIVYFHGFLIL